MKQDSTNHHRASLGLALGGGSARGWAHIGIIRELAKLGVEPDIVAGTSIGALVGGLYAAGHLDMLENWVSHFDKKKIVQYLDVNLLTGGGFLEGKRLMEFFRGQIGDTAIEDLSKPFACVATDLVTGREVWLREGPLLGALRASIALPGLLIPARIKDQWLIDGGMVNPVPVSLCRAMGADVVIAVNIDGGRLGRRLTGEGDTQDPEQDMSPEANFLEKLSSEFKVRVGSLVPEGLKRNEWTPGLFDVLTGSIHIMQDRITRSRMAGDPPEILLSPRLAHIGLLEFERAKEAVQEGRAAVRRSLPALKDILHIKGGGEVESM